MAVSFDATDDWIAVGSGTDILTHTLPLTFYLACKFVGDTSSGGNSFRFFERDWDGGGAMFLIGAAPANIVFEVDGTGSLGLGTVNSAFATGTNTTIIVTWDGGVNTSGVHIYIDGTEAAYAAGGTNLTATTGTPNTPIIMANRTGTPNRNFPGTWYECAIWATVITSASVALLGKGYHHGQVYNIAEASLIKRYYTFDEATSGSSTAAGAFIDKAGIANGTGTMGANGAGLTYVTDGLYYPASMGPSKGLWGGR